MLCKLCIDFVFFLYVYNFLKTRSALLAVKKLSTSEIFQKICLYKS